MPFEDKTIKCVECGADFIFSANEQQFYADKGYQNEPKRCSACRANRRQQFSGGQRGPSYRERPRVEVTCAKCGQKAFVSFKPVQNKPVYCDTCFAQVRAQQQVTEGQS